MISYEKLWKTMKKKGITQYSLIKNYHISTGQLSRLRSNSYVSTHTIDVLCNILNCNVEDIMIHIPDFPVPNGTQAPVNTHSSQMQSEK